MRIHFFRQNNFSFLQVCIVRFVHQHVQNSSCRNTVNFLDIAHKKMKLSRSWNLYSNCGWYLTVPGSNVLKNTRKWAANLPALNPYNKYIGVFYKKTEWARNSDGDVSPSAKCQPVATFFHTLETWRSWELSPGNSSAPPAEKFFECVRCQSMWWRIFNPCHQDMAICSKWVHQ